MIKLMDILLLFEDFDKVSDLLSNPENNQVNYMELLRRFTSGGGSILGQGKYATVLTHPKWKYVVKIFSDDIPYLKFARFCLKNPRPSFPVFYDKPRRIVPNYKRHPSDKYLYVVKMELLEPLKEGMFPDIDFFLERYCSNTFEMAKKYNDNEIWLGMVDRLEKLKSRYPQLVQLKKDYDFLMENNTYLGDSRYNFGYEDLHSGNIMIRKNGQFVLADPFYEGGETPFARNDRLLRAELGYNEDENGDTIMIPGGELPKKKKQVKFNNKPKEPKGDNNIPFE
jgi:hypothetical protein